MTRASQPSGLHPSIVLAAYIEPLVRGRRVAILGDATIGLADELSERGARLVHSYDPDTSRVAEALARSAASRPHQVTHAVLTDDLGVRDGAFDVVVVPDLSIFPDAADVLRRTRRLVAQSGAAVLVAPNQRSGSRRLLPTGALDPKAPGYYELFDLVSLQFAKVRMIGQAPFVGYTVADFAPNGEPEVSVDTSLLTSSEEPEHFIAVASDRPVSLDAFTVVELPWSEVGDALSIGESVPTPRPGALAEAEQRLALAVTELEKLREQKADEAREAEGRAAKWAALSARVGELEGEVDRRDTRLKEIEARAGDSHVRAERQTHQIRDLEEELVRQRDRATRLTKQLDDEKKFRTKAEVELGMLRGRPEITIGKDRIDAMGAELEAARTRISELELEHTETKRRIEAPTLAVMPPPIVLPPPAAPDAKLLHRLNELEQAVNAALREAGDAASQRDAALDRARKAEARIERVTEVEGTLETLRHEKGELIEHAGILETRGSEAERRLGDAERQLVDAEKRAAVLVAEREAAERRAAGAEQRATGAEQRAAGAEQRAAGAEHRASEVVQLAKRAENEAAEGARLRIEADRRAAEAEKRRAEAAARFTAADAKVSELERLAAERGARIAVLSRELDEARRRVDEAGTDKGALDAATAEITALETALRDRGRVVAALSRDLRESDRIGRELLGDLDEANTTNGVHVVVAEAPGPGVAEALELRGRLDALAASAARCEADLTAARWRITQLERELAETPGHSREATAIELELTQALSAARDELASLRRTIAGS